MDKVSGLTRNPQATISAANSGGVRSNAPTDVDQTKEQSQTGGSSISAGQNQKKDHSENKPPIAQAASSDEGNESKQATNRSNAPSASGKKREELLKVYKIGTIVQLQGLKGNNTQYNSKLGLVKSVNENGSITAQFIINNTERTFTVNPKRLRPFVSNTTTSPLISAISTKFGNKREEIAYIDAIGGQSTLDEVTAIISSVFKYPIFQTAIYYPTGSRRGQHIVTFYEQSINNISNNRQQTLDVQLRHAPPIAPGKELGNITIARVLSQ
ncbi:MAG: hypothetical protein ACON35_04100 [Candidatus Marinamargulisbacteria bacterium]